MVAWAIHLGLAAWLGADSRDAEEGARWQREDGGDLRLEASAAPCCCCAPALIVGAVASAELHCDFQDGGSQSLERVH